MNKEILLRQNENDEFELYEEPYAIIEISTEEDFDKIKEAVGKQKAMKPTGFTAKENVKIGNATWRAGTTIYHCPRCYGLISIIYKHCSECGQKIDWSEE